MPTKYWLFLPVLLLLSFSPVQAYTSPGQPTGFVNDYAEVLTPEQEEILEAKLNSLSTSDGSELAVVTIKDLGGDTVENYAASLFAEWGIGKKDRDNGLLLLVAIDNREMRIEVGYGLEGTITDAQAYWIIRDVITPAFRNEDYYSGINGAVDKVTEAITGSTVLPRAEDNSTENSELSDVMAGSVLSAVFLIGLFLGRTKSVWLGGLIGLILGFSLGTYYFSISAGLGIGLFLGIVGLIIDMIFSSRGGGGFGGGSFGGGGGGFGGFGGGRSGGGGSSGRW